jgi:hypothetical protein
MRKFFTISAIALIVSCAQHAQQPPVKFVLSEVEQLKLQVLYEKRKNLTLQEQMAEQQLGTELQPFIVDTLKAHHNPPGVVFDPKVFDFVVQQPTPVPTTPTKPDATKTDKKK